MLTGCSDPPKPTVAPKAAVVEEPPAKILQFYASPPQVARGGKTLLCYGVENAKTVWLSPPKKEVSVALSRCIEVTPEADTTYSLTVEGAGGKTVTQDVKVSIGAPHAKISNVTVSALEVNAGDLVSICWEASNAKHVTVAPLGYTGPGAKGCATDQPRKTTTYTVTATGSGSDTEKITVKVR